MNEYVIFISCDWFAMYALLTAIERVARYNIKRLKF